MSVRFKMLVTKLIYQALARLTYKKEQPEEAC